MLTLLRKIFTWWNQDTFGTRLKTIFFGKLVGTDELGNKYYETKDSLEKERTRAEKQLKTIDKIDEHKKRIKDWMS